MKLWSDSWTNGDRIPERHAAGRPDGAGAAPFSDNLNPHLAWSDVPAAAKSMVLICHDFDVPSRGDDVNKPDREVPSDLPRVDFFHWVMVDIPAHLTQLAEGEYSRGFTPRGKPGPAVQGVPGAEAARHGLNDYTNWFAGHATMAGPYMIMASAPAISGRARNTQPVSTSLPMTTPTTKATAGFTNE